MNKPNVSVNVNFRSISPDHIREITTFALKLDNKISIYVDDEIIPEVPEEDDRLPPTVWIKSDLVEEIEKAHSDTKVLLDTEQMYELYGTDKMFELVEAIRITGEPPMNEFGRCKICNAPYSLCEGIHDRMADGDERSL